MEPPALEPAALERLTNALRVCGVLGEDEDGVWRRLAGGFHNDVHVVDTRAGPVVVKYFTADSGNVLYPQLPTHEHLALQELSGSGIAPEPLAFTADVAGRAMLVYRYVEGAMWSSDVSAVGTLLNRVHAFGIVDGFRRLPANATDVLADAQAIVTSIATPRRLVAHLSASESGQPADPAPGTLTLVHTDCGPGNIIAGPAGLCLIDWQCPGIGDPVEDLANFASPAIHILYGRVPLTAPDVAVLLEGYGEPAIADRFDRLRWAYHTRLAAYCALRTVELRGTRPEISDRYSRALGAELDLLDSRP